MEIIIKNFGDFLKIWGVVLLVNQILFFGACFAPYCLIAALPHTGIIAAVLTYYSFEKDSDASPDGKSKDRLSDFFEILHEVTKQIDEDQLHEKEKLNAQLEKRSLKTDAKASFSENKKDRFPENDALKERGDGYELHIGRKFELKGDLVIYNGLIQGYEDQGVDIIILSKRNKTINLIQCKNWKRMEFTTEHLFQIYKKLNEYHADYPYLEPDDINQFLSLKRSKQEILEEISASQTYKSVRKTLYLSSAQVINDDVWHILEKIKDNIYRYKDMKIVIHQL